MNNIGFSVLFTQTNNKYFYNKLIKQMLESGCTAIEVNIFGFDFEKTPEITTLLDRFKFLSIHANESISSAVHLFHKLNAKRITVHPNFISRCFNLDIEAGIISFENMDWRKSYGKSVLDMKKIFRQMPDAKFTCDLNHIYTIDPSMKLAKDFNEAFSNLSHYHISGFRNDQFPHVPIYKTKQDIIIKSINKTEQPIIIESFGNNDIVNFTLELEHITNVCKNI